MDTEIELTSTQKRALSKLTNEWLCPNELRDSLATLRALRNKGLAESKTEPGYIAFPRSSTYFRRKVKVMSDQIDGNGHFACDNDKTYKVVIHCGDVVELSCEGSIERVSMVIAGYLRGAALNYYSDATELTAAADKLRIKALQLQVKELELQQGQGKEVVKDKSE